MRIAVAADERVGVADAVVEELRKRGHEVVAHGALNDDERAARCADAQTAAGARKWNDANVLALSLRATSEAELTEILDAWFANEPSAEPDDVANVAHLADIEER